MPARWDAKHSAINDALHADHILSSKGMKIDHSNTDPMLMAYADGELDGQQGLVVLDYLVNYPQRVAVLRDHHRLRLTVWRVMRDSTPGVPAAIRERIGALSAEVEGRPDVKTEQWSRPWRLHTRSAAVALVVGLIAGALLPHSGTTIVPSAASLTLATAVTRIYVNCSRFTLQRHAGPFPTTAPMDGSANKVRSAFHADAFHPDLTSVGFVFVGAGPCVRPQQDTIHLLYYRPCDDHRETLSIFVQADHGQVDLPERQIGVLAAADQPHPSYVWRVDGVVFCLVADASSAAHGAKQAVTLAMAK